MGTPARQIGFLCMLFGTGMLAWSQTASISYKAKCEVCHGSTGLADTPEAKRLGALPFTDPSVTVKSDSTLTGIIQNGSGKMPPFKGRLTDQEINNLLQFIRQVQNK